MKPDAGFLEAILESPDDDTPRLVYADWLDEHGGPGESLRAEFIRAQVALARLPAEDPHRADLDQRAQALHDACGAGWQPNVPREVRYIPNAFRRGFVALLSLPVNHWLAQPDRWNAVTPVEGLHFLNAGSHVRDLAACRHLARLRWLSLRSLGAEGVQRLVRSPHLGRLEHLILRNNSLPDDSVLAAGELSGLVALDLDFNHLGLEGVRALVLSLPRLRSLSLAFNALGADGARVLAGLPDLARLAVVNFQGNHLGPEGVRALASSPHAVGLRWLGLASNEAGDEGARALAGSPYLAGLVRLGLYGNALGPDAVAALAGSGCLGGLTELSLSNNPLGPAGARHLAASATLTGLQTLNFNRTSLGDDGVRVLAESPALTGVRRLYLQRNHITAAGAETLARSPHLRGLTALQLDGNPLGDAGAEALAGSPNLAHLTALGLQGTGIGDRGARALAGSRHLPGPPFFFLAMLGGNPVGDAGRQALRDRWGDGVR